MFLRHWELINALFRALWLWFNFHQFRLIRGCLLIAGKTFQMPGKAQNKKLENQPLSFRFPAWIKVSSPTWFSNGAPNRTRTCNLLNRNQMRYPIAPWARNVIILQWEAHFVKRLIGRWDWFPAVFRFSSSPCPFHSQRLSPPPSS